MPRPKKPPRARLQIVFERGQAKALREFCKACDRDISQVVRLAVGEHLSRHAQFPPLAEIVLPMKEP